MRILRKIGKGKRKDDLRLSRMEVFMLPAVFSLIALLVLILWLWPMKREMNRVKENINSHRSELSEQKKLKREIEGLKAFAESHGNNPVSYLRQNCFMVSSKEEIIPFLLDYLPGLGRDFYLFSFTPSHDEPQRIGKLSHKIEVYKVPLSFSFNAYVVEAMGFVSSLKKRKGIWVESISVTRKEGTFPSYMVEGGSCFVMEKSK